MNDETLPTPGPMPTPATLYVYWLNTNCPEDGFVLREKPEDLYDPDYPYDQYVGVYQLVGMKKLKMVPAVVTIEDC